MTFDPSEQLKINAKGALLSSNLYRPDESTNRAKVRKGMLIRDHKPSPIRKLTKINL